MKRSLWIIAVAASTSLGACAVAPPSSPMERHARLAAAAELAARQCGGFIGGYASARELRDDANRNILTARQLGATDADIEKARADARTTFEAMTFWADRNHACNELVSALAWEG